MGRLHVSLTSRLSIKGRLKKKLFKMGTQNKVWEALAYIILFTRPIQPIKFA